MKRFAFLLKLLSLGFLIVSIQSCEKKSKPSFEAPSALQTQTLYPSEVSQSDCEKGLQPLPKSISIDCGTWIKNDQDQYVGGHGTLDYPVMQIGDHTYRVDLQQGNYQGKNFKVSIQETKTIQDCTDPKNQGSSECESVLKEAQVTLECFGKKKIYKRWQKFTGC